MSTRSAGESQDADCLKIAEIFSPFRDKAEVAIDEDVWAKFNQMMTCPICLNVLKDPIFIRCSHRFCRQCIQTVLRTSQNKSCPTCRGKLTTRRDLFSDPLIQRTISDAFGNAQAYQDRIDSAEGKEIAVLLENALWIKNDRKRDRMFEREDQVGNAIKIYRNNSGEETRINQQPSSTDQESDPLIAGNKPVQDKKQEPRKRKTKRQIQEARQLLKGDIVNLYAQIEIRRLTASEYVPTVDFNMIRICLNSSLEKIALFIAEDLNINLDAVHLYVKLDPKSHPILLTNTQRVEQLNSSYWTDKECLIHSKEAKDAKSQEQPFVRFLRESRHRRIMYYLINYQDINTI